MGRSGLLFCIVLWVISFPVAVRSQDASDADSISPRWQFNAYLEAYYRYDFTTGDKNVDAPYLTSFETNRRPDVNIAFVRGAYNGKWFRAALGLIEGSYVRQNLAAEPVAIRNIMEASLGIRLSSKRDIWLDVGVLPSHIGMESVVGMKNWVVTRSLMADNSPYYESGLRWSYNSRHRKFYFALLLLNGWQKMRFGNDQFVMPGTFKLTRTNADIIHPPALGSQMLWQPGKWLLFNWSSYVGPGNATVDDGTCVFNDFWLRLNVSNKFGIAGGFDIGIKETFHALDYWATPMVVVQYKMAARWRMAFRAEYFTDQHEFITYIPNTAGFSANIDYSPFRFCMLRLEARSFQATNGKLQLGNTPSQSDFFVTASACFNL